MTHVTDTVTKTVNCIVASDLKLSEFSELLEAVDSEYVETAGHTNVRWLCWPVCFETSFWFVE